LKNKGIECGWGSIPQKSEKGAKDGNPAPMRPEYPDDKLLTPES
jgi:hypothetical protein